MASKERRVEANGKLATEGEGKREERRQQTFDPAGGVKSSHSAPL